VKAEHFATLHEIPSGTVEPGEGLPEALAREVWAETGLTVTHVRAYVNAFDYISGSGKSTWQFNFAVETTDGEIRMNPQEHDEAMWVIPGTLEFDALNLSDETRKSILAAMTAGVPPIIAR